MKNTEQGLSKVQREIHDAEHKFGREPGSVKLLAVSKTREPEQILAAAALGQRDFGENYLQEALDKIQTLKSHELCWHFIGPIQSNKTTSIAQHFDWVHSVERAKIARRLSDARPAELRPLNICIQVNISEESSKSGIKLAELSNLAKSVSDMPGLALRGLMTMPALSDNFDEQRQAFHTLSEAFAELKSNYPDIDTLSMGTTTDMQAAIAEGATIVRIGTAIFGPRTA